MDLWKNTEQKKNNSQEGTVIQIQVYITIRNDASGGVNDDSKDIFV